MVFWVPLVSFGQQNYFGRLSRQELRSKFPGLRKQSDSKSKGKLSPQDGTMSSQPYGVDYNSISSQYTVFKQDQSWNSNPNPNPKYNFAMFGQGQPAGDINGDGKDDYIVSGVGRDERTTPLEDQIGKTAVFFGGNTSKTPDQLVYANLVPVGDLNGDGYADALKEYQNLDYPSSLIQTTSNYYVIYKGTPSGYQRTSNTLYNNHFDAYGFTDLDQDGYGDLLTYGSSTAYLYWGSSGISNISINQQTLSGLVGGSRKLVAGDVDQDSLEEIVELSGYSGSGQITIFQVDTTTRELTQQQSFAFNNLKYSADQSGLNLIDINGNGYPEIYISADSTGAKYVFPYDTVAQQYSTTPINFFNGELFPVGDLNNDGNFDFIQGDSTNSYSPYISYGPGTLSNKPQLDVKLNGNSSTDWKWYMHSNPYGSFGDLNGDGIDDALLAHDEQSSGNKYVGRRILSGSTSGSYNSAFVQYDFTNYHSQVYETQEIGDINEDGFDDFVISLFDQQKLEIFYGDSTFSQTPGMTINLNAPPAFVTSGDFNGDGKTDLGVLEFKDPENGQGGTIKLFWGGSSMDATADYSVKASDFQTADYKSILGLHNIGDVNNDGIDDFLTGSAQAHDSVSTDSVSYLNETYIFHGGSSISSTPDNTISLGTSSRLNGPIGQTAVALGDINGDGVDDFAIGVPDLSNANGSTGRVNIFYGGSGKTFSTPDMILSPDKYVRGYGMGITVGDFNGDGNSDLAVSDINPDEKSSTSIFIYNGGSGFDNTADRFLTADLNGDGSNVQNNGILETIPDFTRDGRDELLFTSSGGPNYLDNNSDALIYTFENNKSVPSIILRGPNTGAGLGGFVNTASGDFNNDGLPDIIMTQQNDNNDAFHSSRIYRYSLSAPLKITSVEDVPDDQGGWIRVKVGGYLMDAMSKDIYGLDSWGVWRMTADSSWTNVATVQPFSGGSRYVDVHVPKTQPTNIDTVDFSYTFKIVAYNSDYGNNGVIAQSGKKTSKAFDNVAPGQIQGLTVQGQSSPKIKAKAVSRTLSWQTPDDNDISEYEIYPVDANGNISTNPIGSSTSTNYMLSDTLDGVQNFAVRARDTHNNYGESSMPVSAIYPKKIRYDESKGWNLISFPMDASDFDVLTQMIKDSSSAPVYEYDGSYQQVDQLQAGKGYWVKLANNDQFDIRRLPSTKLTLNLNKGWNLISGVGGMMPLSTVSDPDGIIIDSTTYAFNQAYTLSDTLRPGMGYWIRASQAGKVTFTHPKLIATKAKLKQKSSNHLANNENDINKTFSNVVISDGNHSQKLLFGKKLPRGVNKLSYSLPPLPPGNVFDARFKGDTRLVEDNEMYIKLSDPNETPLKLKINVQSIAKQRRFRVKEFADGKLLSQYKVAANKQVELAHKNTDAIYVAPVGDGIAAGETPSEFNLKQNYPNPFNPTTQIKYSVPKASKVKLEIFNILGKRVATLINKEQKPGNYQVTFDGSKLASGMYLYRLQAGNHVMTKKLILAK